MLQIQMFHVTMVLWVFGDLNSRLVVNKEYQYTRERIFKFCQNVSYLIYLISLPASIATTYLALVLDRVTKGCYINNYLTTPSCAIVT